MVKLKYRVQTMVQNTIYISKTVVYQAIASPFLIVIRERRPPFCSPSFFSSLPIIHWFYYFSTLSSRVQIDPTFIGSNSAITMEKLRTHIRFDHAAAFLGIYPTGKFAQVQNDIHRSILTGLPRVDPNPPQQVVFSTQ